MKGIRIIEAKTARREGLVGKRHTLRFGDERDGTQLVLEFLEQAHRAGARYVSDLRIELASVGPAAKTRRRICETRLVPFARGMRVPVKVHIPGRIERRYVPRTVTKTIYESRYECRSVMRPVMRSVTRYQSRYDYTTKSTRSVPVTRMETRYESRQECRTVPKTRTVTRYEYQLQTRFIPPQLKIIAKRFTDFDLLSSKPRCRLLALTNAPTLRLPHRIVGLIYNAKKASAGVEK